MASAEAPFPLAELVEDMQNEIRACFGPLEAFLFSLTSKSNFNLYFDANWKTKSALIDLAVANGHFAALEYLLDYYRTAPSPFLESLASVRDSSQNPFDPSFLRAIRNGHVEFLRQFRTGYPGAFSTI